MDHPKGKAKKLLIHYFRLSIEDASWSADRIAEICALVDFIVDPLQEQIDTLDHELTELKDRVQKLDGYY